MHKNYFRKCYYTTYTTCRKILIQINLNYTYFPRKFFAQILLDEEKRITVTCGCIVLGGEYKSVIATAHFQRWLFLSSNHLKISFVWKSLVAIFVCVGGLKFECVFSIHLSPTLKHLSLAQMHLSPMPKVFVSSTINTFVFYLEGGLENPWKEQKLGGNVSLKPNFS